MAEVDGGDILIRIRGDASDLEDAINRSQGAITGLESGAGDAADVLGDMGSAAKKTKIGLDLTRLVTLQVQQTRFTGMRIKHGYRNISRASKQFLMGDKLLEQCVILSIKEHFFRPMYYQSPIENSFYIVSIRLIIFHLIINNVRAVLSLI